MRANLFAAAAFLIVCQVMPAVLAADDRDTGATKASGCTGCHNAMVNLNGRGADVIAAQSKAIRDGVKAHPPGLSDLSDEDIAEIAGYLDGA